MQRLRTSMGLSVLGLLVLAVGLSVAVPGAVASSSEQPCRPGSGPDLTKKHLTQADFEHGGDLHCANLEEADLQEFNLGQVDLAGANLRGANLTNANLDQATLSYADLSGAKLPHATLIQVTADNAKFTGADLSHANLTQATLSGANFEHAKLHGADLTQASADHADFDHADIGSVDFTQAEIGGSTFVGATGVTPWSMIILILAGVVLVLLLIKLIRAITAPTNDPPSGALVKGIAGAVIIAFGVHLGAGSLIDSFLGAFGAPVEQTCTTGPLCDVGVSSGFFGIWGGILAIIGGGILFVSSHP